MNLLVDIMPLRIKDFTTLKAEISSKLGYKPYYDDFNNLKFIRPKKSINIIDYLLDSYSYKIVFDSDECRGLYRILKHIHFKDESKQGDLDRLLLILNTVYIAGFNLKIKGGCFDYE